MFVYYIDDMFWPQQWAIFRSQDIFEDTIQWDLQNLMNLNASQG